MKCTQLITVFIILGTILEVHSSEWNFQGQRSVPELKEWHFIGPFTVGKTEIDGDPLEAFGGIQSLSPTQNASAKFISELVEGGLVGWERLKIDSNGYVDISPNVNWQNLYGSLNSIAVLEFQGWAVSTFSVPTTQSYLLTCTGIHNIEIDERIIFYHGDIYARNVPVTVSLSAGNHIMRLHIRARAQTRFKCEFKPITDTFSLFPPTFAPDVHNGGFWGDHAWFSVGVQNHQADKWIKNLVLSINSEDVELVESTANDHSIAPGHLLLINYKVKLLKEQSKQEQDECVKFIVNIRQADIANGIEGQDYEVTLRCRRKDQSFMFTFVDHDNTVAHAAAIRPWSQCKGACPVILTLSGVGVPPQNQADSYKYMKKSKSKKEEWLFGMKDMWVLAPERNGAHNWEGTGYQTALSALRALEEMTQTTNYHADVNRLIYAGHSRGGHGSWMLATHFTDRALAVFSASGWTNREYYGDANILFEHDMNNLHMDGFVRHILLSTLAENDVALSAENLKNVPVMARVGGADRSVPAWHMRRYARLLKEIGANISWTEYAGKDHWWWDTETTNDGGVVFDADVRTFFNTYNAPHIPSFLSSNLEVISLNPATFFGKGGFRILQFSTPFQKSKLVVDLVDGALKIKTTNVRRFQLYEVPGLLNASSLPPQGITVDHTHFPHTSTLSLYVPNVHFCASEISKNSPDAWRICEDGDTFQKRQRGPANYGPARQVFARPFAIVIPNSESTGKEVFDFNLRIALYLAYSHYFAVGTRVPIVTDTEMLQDPIKSKKYNFVFLGGPQANALQAKMQSETDVKPQIVLEQDGTLLVGSHCQITKDTKGIGYVYTMSTWDDSDNQPRIHLVVHGTTPDGITDVVKFSFASNQALTRAAYTNMMPDFYVTGPDFRWKGYGGLKAIGFWGNEWEIRNDLGYFGCT